MFLTVIIALDVNGTLFDKEIKKELFNNTIKAWHNYISSFLHRAAHNLNDTQYVHSQHWLLNQLRLSTLFLKFSGQTIENTLNKSHIERATGRLITTSIKGINLHLFKGSDEYYFYLWTIHLDKTLDLNLTFINLYFSTGPNACIAGNISLTNQQVNTQEEGITFCGYKSMQTVYLNYDYIQIKMSVFINTLYHVDALFSVIDMDLVRSYTTPTVPTPLSLKSYHVINGIIIWQSYSITVTKFHHAILSIFMEAPTKYQVHDGPGRMSTTLTSNFKSTFVCATFQCFVTLLSTSIEKHLISYISNKLSIQLNFTINYTDNILLPLHACHSMYCFLNIQSANIQYEINATVNTFLYLGSPLDRHTCIYGGLSIIQELYGDQEIYTICEKYNHLHNFKRSFYSKNSSLFLLMYWYEHYSKINLTLNLSLTKCTSVEMNYCIWPDKNNIIDFDIRHKGSWPTYLFSLQNDGCVILQFRKRSVWSGGIIRRCSFDLLLHEIPLPGTEIVYQIMGMLYQFHGGSKSTNDCFFLSDTTYTKEFYSVVEPEDKLINCQKQTVHGCSSLYTYMIQSVNDTDINFFIKVKFNSPTHQNTFHFNTVMSPVTNSWVDIIIWKRTAQNDSPGFKSYLSEIISLSQVKGYSNKTGNLIEYILLFTMSKNFSDVSEDRDKSIQFNFQSDINTNFNIYLIWTWQVPLSNVKVEHFISLPGKLASMSMLLCTNDVNHTLNIPVKFIWIHDNYKKFSYINGKGNKCTAVNTTSLYYADCLSFQSFHSRHSRVNARKYILFHMYLQYGEVWQYIGHHSPGYSWEESSELCREAGGFLPFFSSRDDFQEVLTLLKASQDIPPLEALFIGVKGSFEKQVHFLLYHCLLILHHVE